MRHRHRALVVWICGLVAACASAADDGETDDSAFTGTQETGKGLAAKTLALTFDDGPGPRTKELSAYLEQQGIAAGFFVMTKTHAADWACWGRKVSVSDCGNRYVQEIHDRGDRGVVLMHDIHSRTIDMVKQIVPALKAQGFSFVRIDKVPQVRDHLVANGVCQHGECDEGVVSQPEETKLGVDAKAGLPTAPDTCVTTTVASFVPVGVTMGFDNGKTLVSQWPENFAETKESGDVELGEEVDICYAGGTPTCPIYQVVTVESAEQFFMTENRDACAEQ